ncbi:MAG: hypothetical protein GX336_07520 [Halanaerobiaceae bacterium]|nr:hypothetical protein [Halanaerobiaceae bacterium]
MEDLISLLVIIGVIVSGLSKLMEKLSGQAAKQPTWQQVILDKEEQAAPVQVQEVEVKKPEPPRPEVNYNFEELEREKRRVPKKTVPRIEKKKEAALFSEGFKEDDLVKGIILAEVLGKPRCRR